jgi:hypothetical protein
MDGWMDTTVGVGKSDCLPPSFPFSSFSAPPKGGENIQNNLMGDYTYAGYGVDGYPVYHNTDAPGGRMPDLFSHLTSDPSPMHSYLCATTYHTTPAV